MTTLRTLVLVLLFPCVLHAQALNHSLQAHHGDAATAPQAPLLAPKTYRVLAVMVQFQIDTDERTSGNGRFDTSHVTSSDVPIDAPPRNASYFEDHLTFLRNYFLKASKGKVIITTTLVPQVVTLQKVMSAYAPAKNGPNAPVAFLAYETWRMVDSLNLVAGSLSAYDAFVLFHAGVGHDIDMVSLLGYDPTDRDIPSLYFGRSGFAEAFGGNGTIPLKDGGGIPNTLILPETESRTIESVSGDILLEYGINGLLCASFGNYLGLPDLFNTRTGATAIGRFGLMDGQGFFSFSGVFPPEPSAWEKYWLGWIDPIDVPNGSSTLQLPAVALADSIYRVPIGPREYYLVENRNRDPERNGQTVTMNFGGSTRTLKFDRDTTGFNFYDVTALQGNITDVENLDWSLPGGVDDSIFYDGGILVWHIDERVIERTIATNEVNADPSRRGIDLEEADGSQDLGQSYGTLSAASGSEIGTALDFWYAGNASPVNENEFSARSHPSTLSNDGGETHITMKDFSARGPRMTVRVSNGDSAIAVMQGFPKAVHQSLSRPGLVVGQLAPGSPQTLIVTTRGDTIVPLRQNDIYQLLRIARMYGWHADGKPAVMGGAPSGLVTEVGGTVAGFVAGPTLADFSGDGMQDVFAGHESGLPGYHALDLREVPPIILFGIDLPLVGAVPPVVTDSLIILCGTNGRVHLHGKDGRFLRTHTVLGDTNAAIVGISRFSSDARRALVVTGSDGSVTFIPDPLQMPDSGSQRMSLGHSVAGPAASALFPGAAPGTGILRAALATTDGLLFLFSPDNGLAEGFPVTVDARITLPPALGDINGDGLRDIVVFSGHRICAYNPSGVLLDGFPVVLPTSDSLASWPIIGDVDGDGDIDVVAVTHGGLVLAYDGHGRSVRGFPLVAGQGEQTAAMFTSADSVFLVVASSATGTVSGWLTGRTSGPTNALNYPWPQYQRDAQHSGVDLSSLVAGVALSSEFLPKNRAYNWPNPVYDRTTQIRYYVKEDARVTVRIFDLAGDLVTEFNGPGTGGRDNEVTWDVSEVQSGIYLARIEAAGNGNTGLQVIKIAVVK